jgi:hypothetical protein
MADGMDLERGSRIRRWLAADAAGRDEAADAAFRAVVLELPRPLPPRDLAGRIARAAVRAPRAVRAPARPSIWSRRPARAAIVTSALLSGFGVVYLLPAVVMPLAARAFVLLIDWATRASVWLLQSVDAGLGFWEILGRLGRALGVVVATPQVGFGLLAFEVLGALALFTLHRLLAADRESSHDRSIVH